MAEQVKKIEVKVKLLDYATKNMDTLIKKKGERELRNKLEILEKTLEEIEKMKYAVIEDMITKETEAPEIDKWTEKLQTSVDPFEAMITDIRSVLTERSKAESNPEVKDSPVIREPKMSAKLPKLHITKFNGTHIDWFRFWNQFQAEIDSSAIPSVTKFSYLRDMLTAQSLSLVSGLPFTSEGYERAKVILQTKFGKTSEVVNAHIQRIMALPTIHSNNGNKIHDFYEALVNSVQSLETMGKLTQIQGYVRMTLDKLPEIRSDLVRLDKDWHEWDFGKFVAALGEWTERNPRNDIRSNQSSYQQRKEPADKSFTTKSEASKCIYCDGNHKEMRCEKVTNTNERRNILKQKRRCFNCTKADHQASKCKSGNCRNCNGRHHTSICDKQETAKPEFMGSTIGEPVIFPTIVVNVNGMKCRALLDCAAGSNYISATLANALNQKPKRTEQRRIQTLISTTPTRVDIYEIELASISSEFSMTCEVSKVQKDVLLKVTNPNYKKLQESFEHLRGIQFNDYVKKEELQVHMVLGVGVHSRIKMRKEPRMGIPGQPVAELTKLGWVVQSPGEEIDKSFLTQSATDYDNLCRTDILGLQDMADGDQQFVFSEFKEQLRRDPEGWYETGLMWKANHDELPNNKAASLRRLNNLICKLKRDPARFEEYDTKIAQQISDGIIEPAPDKVEGREYYIPHKAVIREDSATTKMRIVYDASSKPNDSSPSLNDCLEPGPLLMNRLWTILIRNRMRAVTITGDIKQAFHQIRIREGDRDALRFYWIDNRDTCEITTLRFARAVMGLVQAPFLLSGTLDQHFSNYTEEPPEIVESIKDDMYVDDVIGGANTVGEAKSLKEIAIKVLGDAKFELHKWHSNVPELQSNGAASVTTPEGTKDARILGVSWNMESDKFAVIFPEREAGCTKRVILSYLAAIYDPLGIVSPITLFGKIIYRLVCDRKLGWDQDLPNDLLEAWSRWLRHLPKFIEVPRSIPRVKREINQISLHAFSDASKEGTSAVIYAVVKQEGAISQGLVTSKSRLSKKSLTIPRLELVAALMAANLLKNVHQALSRFPVTRKIAWCDSTATLHWIKGGGQYKEFVRNRVTKIKENKEIEWRYVDTTRNPADIGSRGCQGDKLGNYWLDGPTWLTDEQNWPTDITTTQTSETEKEAKQIREIMASTVTVGSRLWNLVSKFTLWKVLRITSWIRRFITNCQDKKSRRIRGPLTTEEIESSKFIWIKHVQTSHESTDKFARDKESLNLQKNDQGIYLCMGRVEGDYPIYLPSDDVFSEKVVQHSHKRTLHGGVGFTMTDVRRHYWIPRLRRLTKAVIHRCNGCKRFHAIAFARPRIGNLPTDRTVGNRPFQVIGLDFAGPFTYVTEKKTENKAYILLYTCSLTRGVYLDVLADQTLEGVLTSFKSLIARRTRPEKIYSDNFSSFVAMNKWLKQVMREESIYDFLANQEMKWKFNLSRAPWWGGQFERLVGLMKQTIWKSFGKTKPKLEEFKSLMLDVETTINNRPLAYIEDDVQSTVLTPNVMIFDYPIHIPHLENIEEDLDVTVNLKKRYKYMKHAREKIWQRWSNEYLKYLRERHNLKHNEKEMQLKEGDVVIIKGDEKNRAHWKLGIVNKLLPGKDGIVRAVQLRAGKSLLERAPEHLFPLELSCETNEVGEDKKNETKRLDPTARDFRPRRNANAIAQLRIRDQAELEGSVPQIE